MRSKRLRRRGGIIDDGQREYGKCKIYLWFLSSSHIIIECQTHILGRMINMGVPLGQDRIGKVVLREDWMRAHWSLVTPSNLWGHQRTCH